MGMLNSDFTVRKIKLGVSLISPKKLIQLSRLGEIADRRMRRDLYQPWMFRLQPSLYNIL